MSDDPLFVGRIGDVETDRQAIEIEITPKGLYAFRLIAAGMPIEEAEIQADARFSDDYTERIPS